MSDLLCILIPLTFLICVSCYEKGKSNGFSDGYELGEKRANNKHKEKYDLQCRFCNYSDKENCPLRK